MLKLVHRFVLGLLLLPFSTLAAAEMIHWELSSHNIPDYFEAGYTLRGGFDFDTDGNAISNITVKTTAEQFCFSCNDYSGGAGQFAIGDQGQQSVTFSEVFKTGDVTDRSFILTISETLFNDQTPVLDLKKPGVFSNLSIDLTTFLRLDDPLDPDIFEDIGCIFCATATGTVSPVPEPETYAMMLAGLAVMGWRVSRRGKADSSAA